MTKKQKNLIKKLDAIIDSIQQECLCDGILTHFGADAIGEAECLKYALLHSQRDDERYLGQQYWSGYEYFDEYPEIYREYFGIN
jgi:hypothetical protein